jgi:hypothetical protein
MVGGSGGGELVRLLSLVHFVFAIEDGLQRVSAEIASPDEPLVVLLDDDRGREAYRY